MNTTPTEPGPEAAPPTAASGVRWTEHGPEPARADAGAGASVEPGEPGLDADVDDIAAIRARLAERGLVRRNAAPRIRELTGDVTRRPAPPTPATDEPVRLVVPEDAEELEPEPPGPTSAVSCPGCRSSQQVSAGASGYRCLGCNKVWRWAICGHCGELALALARQESWRCSPCGDYSRSWWRTADGRREAPTVIMRRQADEARRQRERALERARARRWKVLLAGVTLIAATAVWALAVSDGNVPETERGATGAVCTRASELRSTFGAGAEPADVRVALDELAAQAIDAIPEVRVAAQQWAASGQPGDETFDAAQKQLVAACAAGT